MIPRRALVPVALLALSLAAVAAGCGSHRSAATTVEKGVAPSTTALVYLATALPCKDAASGRARFTPLVVRGRSYATTLDPVDDCREQPGDWRSYVYVVPVPRTGEVRLTPGNQPTATLDASKFGDNHSATIYYVDCATYYADCPKGHHFVGRISSIEYFKDEDVRNAPD
jgi:hypothetical protein